MTVTPLDFETLAVRALSACRLTHPPTHAGLRILLNSLGNDQGAFSSFLSRRGVIREKWRHFAFQTVKDASPEKPTVYRNCVIGSPLTTLVEAHALHLMAADQVFAVPGCAYSYNWPADAKSGRNFAYFLDGYERRNRIISELLNGSRELVAVVADIKSFYPSVDKGRIRSRVEARARMMKDAASSKVVTAFVHGLLDCTPKVRGLPIGPDTSHALGHLALESVDSALAGRFGDAYLRYVDDIVVVCPKDEAGRAYDFISSELAKEGLQPNDAKQDVVSGRTWRSGSDSDGTRDVAVTFDSLIEELLQFLVYRRAAGEELERRFREAGFSFRIDRFRALAQSDRYRAVVRSKSSLFGSFYKSISFQFVSPASLVANAEEVRQSLLRQATVLAESAPPANSMSRRWYVQHRRLVLNRLLYLLSPGEYGRLRPLVPQLDEFVEYRAVLDSLVDRNCTRVLDLPGRVTWSIGQLWPTHLSNVMPAITWPVKPTRANAEAAAQLALTLSVRPPSTFLDTLGKATLGGRLLLDLCSGNGGVLAQVEPMSYLDEMGLLFASLPRNQLLDLLNTRYDSLDDLGLDALSLGGGASPLIDGGLNYLG